MALFNQAVDILFEKKKWDNWIVNFSRDTASTGVNLPMILHFWDGNEVKYFFKTLRVCRSSALPIFILSHANWIFDCLGLQSPFKSTGGETLDIEDVTALHLCSHIGGRDRGEDEDSMEEVDLLVKINK